MAASSQSAVFLTGGTGLLGRELALRFARTGRPVLLHVRKNSRRRARGWLAEFKAEEPEAGGRVRLLTGDISPQTQLLDARSRARVIKEADTVVHCAAVTDPAADRAFAYEHNVGGTEAVLHLAREIGGLRRFVHLSDSAIAGDHAGLFTEAMFLVGQGFAGAQVESKLVAERKVRAASRDLPVTILRPGGLVGDVATGRVDRPRGAHQLVAALLKLQRLPAPLRRLPLLPMGSCARVRAVPVDWVADAAVALIEMSETAGGTFHLTDPFAPTLRELVELIGAQRDVGRPLLSLPRSLTRPLWRGPAGRPIQRVLDQAFNLPPATIAAAATCAAVDSSQAERLLRPLGLGAPPPMRSWIEGLVRAAEPRGLD